MEKDKYVDEDLPSREEIEEEDDLELLLEWHEDAIDLLDNIRAQMAAWHMAGRQDPSPNWSLRTQHKAGFAGAALKRIERRIIRLGGDLPLTVEREEREQIGKLRHRVASLEHFIQKRGLFDELDSE